MRSARGVVRGAAAQGRGPGFSLMEMVAVLLVVAVLAVFALPRLSSTQPAPILDANSLKGYLRYTQSMAMADIVSWSLTVEQPAAPAATKATIKRAGAVVSSHSFQTRGVSAGITTFDPMGVPAGTMSYTVTSTDGSAAPVTFTIAAATGFIP